MFSLNIHIFATKKNGELRGGDHSYQWYKAKQLSYLELQLSTNIDLLFVLQRSTLQENMLKNWTVTTQSVKNAAFGVMTREIYLTSTTHKNHKDTQNIIELIGSQKTSQRIALKGEQFRTNQIAHRRRGRPLSSYAVEFCLTLPRGIRPSVGQWKLVLTDCCRALSKHLDLSAQELTEFKYLVRAVLHQQPQVGKLGSGDHVHLIIGKVVANRILKDVQRKQSTKLIKTAFNAAIPNTVALTINYMYLTQLLVVAVSKNGDINNKKQKKPMKQ